MSLYDAERERDAAVEHICEARRHLSHIVVEGWPGTSRYSKEHMRALRAAYIKLLELRDEIMEFDGEDRGGK